MAGLDWTAVLPWLVAAAVIAAAGAWLARRHALRHGLLDQPGERRSHGAPTPRGGGVGIVVAWVFGCAALGLAGRLPASLAVAAFIGSLLVGGAGFVDDHRPLSPWLRLVVHVLAGVVLAAGLLAAGAAPWLALLALVGVPVMVNVWNFMDGIDGLATSQAALAALGFALLSQGQLVAPPALLLAAACIGFLPFNFPKARIFLGDVGSGALGFALALLALLLLLESGEEGGPGLLLLAFLPVSAFLIDATLTLAWRMVRREKWWTAHVEHAYQRLAARIGSHVPVTLAYGAWTAVAVSAALLMAETDFTFKLAAAGSCIVAGTLAWRAARTSGPGRKH